MKKKNVLNLIKYHVERNDEAFKNEALEISQGFAKIGDNQISDYILTLISETNVLTPQELEIDLDYIKKIELSTESLPLPKPISDDLYGMINAINHNVGINKFLFEGKPGSGKTESAKHIARILKRDLYNVDFSELMDSKLGETSKNIVRVFENINNPYFSKQSIILFDEIDIIALDRVNSSDIREMGRVTSIVLRELDKLNEDVVLIATTNLFGQFDKAISRRFDKIINFNRYTEEDLLDISEKILNKYLVKFPNAKREIRLFKKIINKLDEIPFPAELENLIKNSLAFSSPVDEYGYLKELIKEIYDVTEENYIQELYKDKFTLREIEIITGISKSKVSRDLKE